MSICERYSPTAGAPYEPIAAELSARPHRLRAPPAASTLARGRPRRGAIRTQSRGRRGKLCLGRRWGVGKLPFRDHRGAALPDAPYEYGVVVRVRLAGRVVA